MQKIYHLIQNQWLFICQYFSFTKRDRNGVKVLIILIFFSIIIRKSIEMNLFNHTRFPSTTESENLFYSLSSYPKNNYPNFLKTNNSYKSQRFNQKDSGNYRKYIPPNYMKKEFVIWLNSADTLDFQQLRGIGSAYAKRIVAYRERLGGFICKEQLMEVWGIDSILYYNLEPFLRLNNVSLHLLSLNDADIYQLKRHPYLDYYQAKEIIKHREKYGSFKNIQELRKVNLIDEGTFLRLKPYLSVEISYKNKDSTP
ncbi:MAG: helix-hairpin-helix domain-containing protein [Bacteroidales bacterium]